MFPESETVNMYFSLKADFIQEYAATSQYTYLRLDESPYRNAGQGRFLSYLALIYDNTAHLALFHPMPHDRIAFRFGSPLRFPSAG